MATEILAKTALHYHERTFATNWDLNIYRGCGHRCRYCFAQYSHKYLSSKDFFGEIFVKTNIAEVLNKEFLKKSWKFEPVTVCGISDCYQPIEARYKLMPKVLEVFIRHKNPIVITTKSTLILRDIELIKQLNEVASVNIATSVSSFDDDIRKKIEPNAPPTIERLKMLKEFKKMGCKTTVLFMPIIPYLTDDPYNLDKILKTTSEFGIDNIITGSLHLRGNTKNVFFSFIKDNYPDLLKKYSELYKGSNASKEYRSNLHKDTRNLRKKYCLFNTFSPRKVIEKDVQQSLF